MKNIKKILLITGVVMVMGLGLTGCTGTKEKAEDTGAAAPKTETPADGENTDSEGGQNADAAGTDQEDAPSSPRHIPDTEGDLHGEIYEIGDQQFTVTEIHTEELDDGTELAVMETEDAEKITVVYDENTVFQKQKLWNGGADHEEEEGTAADLKKDLTAEMWGSYEGDVFHATAVRIVEVILE